MAARTPRCYVIHTLHTFIAGMWWILGTKQTFHTENEFRCSWQFYRLITNIEMVQPFLSRETVQDDRCMCTYVQGPQVEGGERQNTSAGHVWSSKETGVISNEAASCVYLPDSSLCYEPNTRLRRYVMSYIETFITHHTAHQGLRCQNSACVSLLYVLHVQPISSPLDLITPVIFREEYK